MITNGRYQFISEVVSECLVKNRPGELSTSDKIDRIVTNRWLALPIFAFVMWLVYYISIQTVGATGTDWVNEELFGAIIPDAVEGWLKSLGVAVWLKSLILDGIIAGVGAVLGFLPQMMVLFLCLAILEDCGYMARIAFIMDRIFRRFGLSGKSFIPLLVGTGCSVPGIMASRTIEREKDRRYDGHGNFLHSLWSQITGYRSDRRVAIPGSELGWTFRVLHRHSCSNCFRNYSQEDKSFCR